MLGMNTNVAGTQRFGKAKNSNKNVYVEQVKLERQFCLLSKTLITGSA